MGLTTPPRSSAAALVAALAAGCGADERLGAASRDAAATDAAAIDAAIEPDATPVGTLTVTARRRCCFGSPGPAAGIALYAVGLDGAVRDTATTAADGTAMLEVVDWDVVTAVYPHDPLDDGGVTLYTVERVSRGDHLGFGDPDWFAGGGAIGAMTVSYPIATGFDVVISTPCGTWSGEPDVGAVTIVLSGDCPATGDVLLALVDADYQQLGWGLLADVDLSGGATATLGAWQSPTTLPLSLTVPPEVDLAVVLVSSVLDGVRAGTIGVAGDPEGAALTADLHWYGATGDRIYTEATMHRPGGYGSQSVARTHDRAAATLTMVEPQLLPWLTPLAISARLRAATWLQTPGHSYDGAVLTLRWQRPAGRFEWVMLLPPGQTGHIDFPTLPPAIGGGAPGPDEVLEAELRLIETTVDHGYDEFRARPLWEVTAPRPLVYRGELDGAVLESVSAGL